MLSAAVEKAERTPRRLHATLRNLTGLFHGNNVGEVVMTYLTAFAGYRDAFKQHLDELEGALRLVNLKQRRRANRTKLVYVDPVLIGDLRRLATDSRVPTTGYLFGARQHVGPVSRQYAWRLVNRYAAAVGVLLPTSSGALAPATARDFRHGAAVNQVRQGVPLSEVAQQLGHARLDTTAIYARLANPERRAMADRVRW